MNRRDNAKGWIFFTVALLGLGLVGHMEEAEAREVVCMPVVDDPKPSDEGQKIPATFTF